ncbi:transposase Tn3 [Caballeronia calidae]|uniref:Transposase Tn3 n=1 Tax=Caballeronia calidae TaxID=1777139 RepID=A0A158DZB8_9BURK|nr:transposase Tn3 [Caballeronia calidae]
MEHWQVTYLGIRQIPRELTDFDLAMCHGAVY